MKEPLDVDGCINLCWVSITLNLNSNKEVQKRKVWFSKDQRTNRQGREDREEKTRILASFACFALKK
jgi:hypothetical protein